MPTLAEKFQTLIDQGVIVGTPDAPRFEPLFEYGHQPMRTVYNLGEIVIRGRVHDAELVAGVGRNPNARS